MSTSQNGYPVLEVRYDGPLPRLRRWVIPGTGRHLILRDGSAGFVLLHLALWLHETVERIDHGVWDEWGWASRPVRGSSTTTSNHASGTACDLNATLHPLGKRGTFSPAQAKRIRRRLRIMYLGMVRWGGDYRIRADEMHFELVRPLGSVERLARGLMRTKRGRRILAANPGAREVIES